VLFKRILTASVLIPLVLAALFYFPPLYFAIFVITMIVLAAFEWVRIVNIEPVILKWLYPVLLVLLLIYVLPLEAFILLAAILYLMLPLWLHTRPVEHASALMQRRSSSLIFMLIGILYLLPAGKSLFYMYENDFLGSQYILFCMLLVWTADIGAYFSGRRFGKTKLAPHISPGKTREGVYGALVLSTIVAIAGAYYLGHRGLELIWVVIIALLTVVYSVYGDLLESVFKRAAGVKDSGNILPGHGGVLDRIDSLLIAAPIMTAGLIVIQP